jgi:hypothetical protein
LPGPELEPEPEPEPEETEAQPAAVVAEPDGADSEDGDWGYVPMSEWGDDLRP